MRGRFEVFRFGGWVCSSIPHICTETTWSGSPALSRTIQLENVDKKNRVLDGIHPKLGNTGEGGPPGGDEGSKGNWSLLLLFYAWAEMALRTVNSLKR